MERQDDKSKRSASSSSKHQEEEPPKKKRATEAERLEKEARSFVEGGSSEEGGKLKKTLTDYVRDKGEESSPKKKRTTAAERLEAEARRFVEITGKGTEGELKRTLTDFVWDKDSLRQNIREISKGEDAEKDKGDTEEEGDDEGDLDEQKKTPAAKSSKKGTKRKARDPPKTDDTPDIPDWKVQEYSRFAGQQHIPGASKDSYGNAKGNQYDLIRDNAMKNREVLVLNIYNVDFTRPDAALKVKGFKVTELKAVPSPSVLRKHLITASQLWVVSTNTNHLQQGHIDVIKEFFDKGRGLYLMGDNAPYYADANQITEALFGTSMSGDVPGDQNVGLAKKDGKAGFRKHLATTGVETLYEGVTIATIDTGKELEPLLWGSADNVVIAFYDKNGKRAMVDGGFTRLFYKWDAAGTARFVKNCAGWLTNLEAAL